MAVDSAGCLKVELSAWLSAGEWVRRRTAHESRVDRWIRPHLERRRHGEKHPVHDFLFDYYAHRPAALRRWHPGYDVGLRGSAAELADWVGHKGYAAVPEGVAVDPAYVRAQRDLVERLHALLVATAGRPPTLGCFGLHEWAMVYRQPADEVRHPWPLRLGADGTDEVVASHRIACSHFDAFRFFTPAARGLNVLAPGRDDRASYEQPGCLHAGMDLYKHAFRLSPMVPSELVADCFELAWDIRVLDMRAAPYDFTGLTLDNGEPWTPLRIENPDGKAEYVAQQRAFAERGQALRHRLIAACEGLLR